MNPSALTRQEKATVSGPASPGGCVSNLEQFYMNKTQCERLLDRLEAGHITAMDAWSELGIARLSARVHELRKDGSLIVKRMIKVSNRFGESCRVASYELGQR